MSATRPAAWIAGLLSVASPHLPGAVFPDEVLADAPVAYFRFGEASDAVEALDTSPHGNHAGYFAGAEPGGIGLTPDQPGALVLPGAGSMARVEIPPLFDPAATSFTLEALFRTDAVGEQQAILQQAGPNGRTLMFLNADGGIRSFAGGAAREAGVTVAAGETYHIAFVFERTGASGGEGVGTWRWFVNGESTASGTFEGSDGMEPETAGFLVGLHKNLFTQPFDGIIDEIAIYPSALPAERIRAHFEAIDVPPLISSFSASPASVGPGGVATLSWEVAADGIAFLAIEPGIGDVLAETDAGAGSISVTPSATTTYRLTAADAEGGSDSRDVTVTVGATTGFRLNEILAVNGGPVEDEDGDESDWIEIANPTASVSDLSGWFLTDDPAVPDKWRFPATPVPAGGFVLVFASGKDRAVAGAELHANFALESDGEFLALVEPDGRTIHDAFGTGFPEQLVGVSYGRVPADGTLGYFRNPTPDAANDGDSVAGFIADPVEFSHPRGFHDEPFDLELTTAAQGGGVEIRYTTDSSEPGSAHGSVYGGPIPITTTTVVRAGVFAPGRAPIALQTRTFIFLDDVLDQPRSPSGYPSVWQPGVTADYAMDRSVADAQVVKDALRALPTLSLAMEIDDWFDNSTNPNVGGIYSNSTIARGRAWERRVSAEFFDFDHGQEIQLDCGIRIFGNASRQTSRPKHNMRLVFRSSYGASKLVFPVFGGDDEPDEVNSYLLRGQNGDSWVHPNSGQRQEALYIRDQLARSLQAEMGQPATRQDHIHVYINGLYWGVFNTIERIEDDSMAEAFGGREEEWDVIKSSRSPGMEPVDGTLDTWRDTHALAEAGVADPAEYAAIQEYLDLDNLIDFLLVNFWNGNTDWDDNNFQAGRRRAPGETWKFFVWDSERTLLSPTQNSTTKNFVTRATRLHHRLRENPEYRLRFADRVHGHFFNDGALTPDGVRRVFDGWVDFLRLPLVAESARWGDTHRAGNPYLVDREWQSEVNYMRNSYMGGRSATVLNQLRSQGLYPDVEAPTFNRHGGSVERGFALVMDAPVGEIWFTVDGSDPRVPAVARDPVVLVDEEAAATALIPSDDSLGAAWRGVDFDDSSWTAGTTGIGFEITPDAYTPMIGIDAGAAHRVTASVLARVAFDIPDQATLDEIDRLVLSMKYDDGFRAWINGIEVADANAPAELTWSSWATGGHPDDLAVEFEEFDATEGVAALRVGRNILAIHCLNSAPTSSDMLMVPRLTGESAAASGIGSSAVRYSGPTVLDRPVRVRARALSNGEWSAVNSAAFFVDTVPAAATNLVISEIHYHPITDQQGLEFVELLAIGDRSVDLTGVRFTDGLSFDFSSSSSLPVPALRPGERIVLVGNRERFEALHGPDVPVAGVFGGDLANDGERITLVGADGAVIRDFVYNDKAPWPEAADGDGPSLVLVAPEGNPDHGDPANWQASGLVDGTPGRGGSTTFPGGDAEALARYAFGGSGAGMTAAIDADGRLVVRARRNLLAEDLAFRFEASGDLGGWTEVNDLGVIAVEPEGDGFGIVTLRSDEPLEIGPETAGRRFFRWRADLTVPGAP